MQLKELHRVLVTVDINKYEACVIKPFKNAGWWLVAGGVKIICLTADVGESKQWSLKAMVVNESIARGRGAPKWVQAMVRSVSVIDRPFGVLLGIPRRRVCG